MDFTGVEGLSSAFVQLSDDQPGGLLTIPLPSMDRGNHLSYGYQWIAFGILAPIGLGWFVYSEIRERRRAEQEQAELEALGTSDTPDEDDSTEDDSTETASTHAVPVATEAHAEETPTEHTPAQPADAEPVVENHTTAASRRRRARYSDAHPDHYAKFDRRSQDRA